MRIVSWNCRAPFTGDKKAAIDNLNPIADILVVQECTKEQWNSFYELGDHSCWYGDCKDGPRGIGIYSQNYILQCLSEKDPVFRYIIPFTVIGEGKEFTLFCVWTKNYIRGDSPCIFSYVENLHKAVDVYNELLKKDVVLVGDFNSNEIWDAHYKLNHTELLKKFAEIPLLNCAQKQNKENMPTFSYWRNGEKNFVTDDYCFASPNLWNKVSKVEVVSDENWHKLSDHCPIIVDFEWP